MAVLAVKAEHVTDNHNGTFTIHLGDNADLWVDDAHETIKRVEVLLPDLRDAFYSLLSKQVLLNSIATDAEVTAKPKSKPKSVQVPQV